MLPRIGFIQFHGRRLQNEFSALGHSISGVNSQVHQNLFELRWIDLDVTGIRLHVDRQFHIFTDQSFQELLYVPDDGIGVYHARLDELLPAKRQKLLGEICGATCRLVDRFGSPVNGRITSKFTLKQFGLS
jgi:hypothetical protein